MNLFQKPTTMVEHGGDSEPVMETVEEDSREEEKENRILGIKVLAVIREAQQKHGLRYTLSVLTIFRVLFGSCKWAQTVKHIPVWYSYNKAYGYRFFKSIILEFLFSKKIKMGQNCFKAPHLIVVYTTPNIKFFLFSSMNLNFFFFTKKLIDILQNCSNINSY